METLVNTRIKMSNLLLIAGNGRNVGKTYFASKIIKQLSNTTCVTGLKISAHFHPYNEHDVVFKTGQFIITQEKQINSKDSSLMLQAGAEKVYFIMAKQAHLQEAFKQMRSILPQHAIVCESGGLHEIITPGLFFFIKQTGSEIEKKQHLNYSPLIVNNDGNNFDFDINNINFSNRSFLLINE
jgi:hypothetical protein